MSAPAHVHRETSTAPVTRHNADALARKLRRKIKGEVRFDDGSRALYATDSSNYRQVPIGVVIPRDTEDVLETVALCRQFEAPILPRGGGTSLAGQCCNVAVIIDFSKYVNRVIAVDPGRRIARVEPGLICDHLNDAVKQHGLFWGPAPATHRWATFGGMIGNNSCGVHSQLAGRTSDNIEELEILTYRGARLRVGRTSEADLERILSQGGARGEIYSRLAALRDRYATAIRRCYPKIPRRISGFGINELLPERGFHVARALVGSEGTCAVVLEATVQLRPAPRSRVVLVLGFPNIYEAADHIPQVIAHNPMGLEGIDGHFIDCMREKHLHTEELRLLPEGRGFLLVEFGGDSPRGCAEAARKLTRELGRGRAAPTATLIEDASDQGSLWAIRDSGLGATAQPPGNDENHEGWEDSAVAPEQLGRYLRELAKLYEKHGYRGSFYGHFGHGCVHTRINFDLKTARGIRRFRSFAEDAANLVAQFGGSYSGEHGDGQSRAEFLPKLFGPDVVRAFEEFKSIWDPDWKMNPGKVVRPHRITDNLRYGAEFNLNEPRTHFKFPDDGFSFAHATMRCVGVGECRRHEHGTMCPSFMATHEEMHTTRGRARLLFEMLQGNPLRDGWRSEAVKEALDLCLACKGCKSDCPVHVDIATYKAEFMSHYYQRRLRPIHAYAFGLIHRWARMASVMPRVANFFAQSRLFSPIGKWLVGIAPGRELPRFAEKSFQHWCRAHRTGTPAKTRGNGIPAQRRGGVFTRVLLWPDTFNNFFHPHIARAAVKVLEDAGFQVIVPEQDMCCGRPLFDYGMLDTAERWLRHILDVLRDEIRAGTPVVMLEPSCCATFRDELTNLLPHDLDARRLKEQTFLLSEILEKKGYEPLQLDRKALVHFHCHHGAIMKKDCEMALLRKLGLDFHVLDSGCCGMAGAFGFEKGEHYEVSIQCGERVLLPAVRQADRHTLIVTDGFSCHEQIRQQTGREALHLAQVLELAMREGRRKPRLPESAPRHTDAMPSSPKRGWFAVGAVAAGILAAKLLLGTRNSRFGRGAILTRRNTDGKLKRSRKARKETRHVSPARGG